MPALSAQRASSPKYPPKKRQIALNIETTMLRVWEPIEGRNKPDDAQSDYPLWQRRARSHLKRAGYPEPSRTADASDAHLWAAKAGTRGQSIPWKHMTPVAIMHIGLAASSLKSPTRKAFALKRVNAGLCARGMAPLAQRWVVLPGASKNEALHVRSLCMDLSNSWAKNSELHMQNGGHEIYGYQLANPKFCTTRFSPIDKLLLTLIS